MKDLLGGLLLSTIGMFVFGAITSLTAPSCHGHIEWWMIGFFLIQLSICAASIVFTMLSTAIFVACLMGLIFNLPGCNHED